MWVYTVNNTIHRGDFASNYLDLAHHLNFSQDQWDVYMYAIKIIKMFEQLSLNLLGNKHTVHALHFVKLNGPYMYQECFSLAMNIQYVTSCIWSCSM